MVRCLIQVLWTSLGGISDREYYEAIHMRLYRLNQTQPGLPYLSFRQKIIIIIVSQGLSEILIFVLLVCSYGVSVLCPIASEYIFVFL